MAIDITARRSRRALLASAAGALAAASGALLARVDPVLAEGETIKVGGEYPTAQSTTVIENHVNGQTVLKARSNEGTALYANSQSDIAIQAVSGQGTGIDVFTGEGTSIHVFSDLAHGIDVERGRVRFKQVSGVATIPAGASSVTLSPGVGIVRASFVLLTPRAYLGGRDLWYTTDPAADTFTIHLSSPSPSRNGFPVAWLLLG